MAKSKKKTFLAVFLGTKTSMRKWERLPAKVRQQREAEGLQAWHAWVAKNKKSIVDIGGPLGFTKKATRRGITNTNNEMGAFTVVTASSHAAAAALFKKHPHFMIFPGDSVEVMECLEIPGM
jgi:hypothetical protein